jgi:hypothetical protein
MKRHSVAVRVALMLWIVWRGVKWFINGSSPFEIVADVIIIVLIAYEIWPQHRFQARARRKKLSRTFNLVIDSGPAANIAPGHVSKMRVAVKIGYQVILGKFGLRFVEDITGGNVSPNIVRIEELSDKSSQTPDSLRTWSDEKGGYYGMWESRPIFDAGDALHLELSVRVADAWKGFLSFKSYDADNEVRFARVPITFHATRISDAGSASSTMS